MCLEVIVLSSVAHGVMRGGVEGRCEWILGRVDVALALGVAGRGEGMVGVEGAQVSV